jgi:hypothetical protein
MRFLGGGQQMNRLLVVVGLLTSFTVLGQIADLGDRRLALIDDPLRVDFKNGTSGLTKEKIRLAISIIAATKDWKVIAETSSATQLTRTVSNRHVMKIEIAYDLKGYEIQYLESADLLYAEQNLQGRKVRAIHKNYNMWVRELSAAINTGLGISALAYVAAPLDNSVRTAEPSIDADSATSSAKPAGDGLPSVGAVWTYSYRDQHYSRNEQLFTVRVLGVSGWTVHESFNANSGVTSQNSIEARELHFAARPLPGGGTVIELAPYFAAEPGKPDWSTASPAKYPGGTPVAWTVSRAQTAEEQISVPAGTFKATRVQIRGSSPAMGTSSSTMYRASRFVYTAWYAPEVKRYVMVRHETWSGVGAKVGDEIVKLVRYNANGRDGKDSSP